MMKSAFRLQVWAGPLVIGAFAVMAVSGVMMFFHLNGGAVKFAHEWLGWLMVIGGVAHVLVNWQSFLKYFRKPIGAVIVASIVALGLVSLCPFGGSTGRPPFMNVAKALEQSSLSVVAQVVNRDVQTVMHDLTANGLRVQHERQTLADIAAENDRPSMEVVACVFGNISEPRGNRNRE